MTSESTKHIFTYNYPGGMCGDFICLEISKDENFYPSVNTYVNNGKNRYTYLNPLEQYGIRLKSEDNDPIVGIVGMSPFLREEIEKRFSEKNLIIPSHKFRLFPIPRIKMCRVYANEEWVPFYYSMLILKTYTDKIYLDNIDTTNKLSFDRVATQYKNNQEITEIIENIKNRGWYYQGEIFNLKFFYTQSKRNLTESYERYFKTATTKLGGALRKDIDFEVNIDELMTDPENNVAKWAELFDMAAPLNIQAIKDYHSRNLALIQSNFSKSYEDWVQGDWLTELVNKVEELCPDMLTPLKFE